MTIPEDIVQKLSELSVEEVAEQLGISVKRHKAVCFMHDDHSPSLTFSMKKNMFFCFVCGKGGGPIQLVMEYEGWTFLEACVWLGKEFNIWWPEVKIKSTPSKNRIRKKIITKETKEEFVFDEEVFTWLIEKARLSDIAKRFLFEKRLFKEDVIKTLKIGSVTYPKRVVAALTTRFGEERCLNAGIIRRGDYGLYFYFYTPCLLFPYYERDGRLIGLQSRYLGTKKESPRFQFLSSQKTRLFNLPILNNLKRKERLYVCEGITDCMALLSSGMNAVAIPSATILPEEDLSLLKEYDLYMFPDQDEAGEKAYNELRRFFVNNYSSVKAEKLPEGVKDYSEYYIRKQNDIQR